MISSATNKAYIQYPVDVIAGNVIAGKHIKKACERFFSLMDDDRYMFLEEKVDKVIRSYHHLRHFKFRQTFRTGALARMDYRKYLRVLQ